MTIILLIFFIFIVITSRIEKNEEYLSKDNTNTIKGIFLFFVFISHFIGYKVYLQDSYIDTIGVTIIKKMGQLMVTLFLFYSGYGIMESAKKKGTEYINNLPRKRILTTLLHFDIAVLVFMIASRYFITHDFSLKKLVLSLIGWDGFGNSNWYIFCIIILYFIAYLSLKSFKNKKNIVISMFIGTLLYTIIMSFYKETWWYNTAFCFALGFTYSAYKEKIEEWIKGKELISFVYTLIIFIITYKIRKNMLWYHINTLAFTLIIILLTRRIKIKNTILLWMGKNLFPLYIFQRLPMMILSKYQYMCKNTYIFFFTAMILTVIITFTYKGLLILIDKLKTRNIARSQ